MEKHHEPFPKYLSEFVGTFFLTVVVGCNVLTGSIGAALSIGAILMVMTYALGSVSGAHFNPAVTIAHGIAGGPMEGDEMACYILAQIAGGVLGAFTYVCIFSNAFVPNVGAYSRTDAAWAEILYTMGLCYVALHLANSETRVTEKQSQAASGLAIGLVVTASIVAIAPISGCSLNPAVSFGSLWAAKLVHGPQPTHLWALYILSPLGGAALAALAYYFSKPESEAPPPQPSTPIQFKRQPYVKRGTVHLNPSEVFVIPESVTEHTLFFGISWECTGSSETADMDASCVKFSSDGQMLDTVYFANRLGKEDKGVNSVVVHLGDNVTGYGEGFGMFSSPNKKKKHGQAGEAKDAERIEIRSLKKLRKAQPKATYLFFVVNVFSGTFKNIKEMTIRLVDTDDSNHEICRFETLEGKKDGTGFVLGVLFWRDTGWIFKVLDESCKLREHGTSRHLEPQLASIVRKLEGNIEFINP